MASIEQNANNWKKIIRPYLALDERKAWCQVSTSIIPFFALWYLAYQAYLVSFWLSLPISLLNGGFLIRMFVIMHDCGHGTAFKSPAIRDFIGYIFGFLHLTPYRQWCNDHAIHHSTSGNLDKNRKFGNNIWTVTAREYSQFSFLQKCNYYFHRHPCTMLFIIPVIYYFVLLRLVQAHDGPGEKRSVVYTNIFIALAIPFMCWLVGWQALLLIHLPTALVAQITGFYFFYVQHQYQNAYWRNQEQWNFFDSCMKGSSFFKLPRIINWFTVNIGYHHIHHLCHLIPNYNLRSCHEENALFQNPVQLNLWQSLRSFSLHIFDESTEELISFRQYKKRYPKGVVPCLPPLKVPDTSPL